MEGGRASLQLRLRRALASSRPERQPQAEATGGDDSPPRRAHRRPPPRRVHRRRLRGDQAEAQVRGLRRAGAGVRGERHYRPELQDIHLGSECPPPSGAG